MDPRTYRPVALTSLILVAQFLSWTEFEQGRPAHTSVQRSLASDDREATLDEREKALDAREEALIACEKARRREHAALIARLRSQKYEMQVIAEELKFAQMKASLKVTTVTRVDLEVQEAQLRSWQISALNPSSPNFVDYPMVFSVPQFVDNSQYFISEFSGPNVAFDEPYTMEFFGFDPPGSRPGLAPLFAPFTDQRTLFAPSAIENQANPYRPGLTPLSRQMRERSHFTF